MECVSSENCQNWFWPKWPCLWRRAAQFSRSGAQRNADIARESYELKMAAGSSQTCGAYNRFVPKLCIVLMENKIAFSEGLHKQILSHYRTREQ